MSSCYLICHPKHGIEQNTADDLGVLQLHPPGPTMFKGALLLRVILGFLENDDLANAVVLLPQNRRTALLSSSRCCSQAV